jgi:hypothetical protein
MAYKAQTQRTSRMKGNIIMLWLVVALVVIPPPDNIHL